LKNLIDFFLVEKRGVLREISPYAWDAFPTQPVINIGVRPAPTVTMDLLKHSL